MDRTEYEILAAVEDRHWWHGGMRAIASAMLDTAYPSRHDLHILDAGCGVGGNLLFLRRYGCVVGLDLSPQAIELARERLPGVLARGSVLELPFAAARFDLVTSFDVLYHRAVTSETQALRETARVLRPGGRLLMRLPAYEFLRSKHDRAVHTRRRYTEQQVVELLRESGFVIEHISYVNTLLFPLPLTQRLIERVFPILEQKESDLALPSPLINELLRWPLATEAAWLARGGTFPVGLSIMCLARQD